MMIVGSVWSYLGSDVIKKSEFWSQKWKLWYTGRRNIKINIKRKEVWTRKKAMQLKNIQCRMQISEAKREVK